MLKRRVVVVLCGNLVRVLYDSVSDRANRVYNVEHGFSQGSDAARNDLGT